MLVAVVYYALVGSGRFGRVRVKMGEGEYSVSVQVWPRPAMRAFCGLFHLFAYFAARKTSAEAMRRLRLVRAQKVRVGVRW